MSDVGTQIAPPYRSSSPHSLAVQEAVAEAMRPAITDRLNPEPAGRSTVAAGADVPERDAANGVAAEQDASLSYADATHDDGVKHGAYSGDVRGPAQGSAPEAEAMRSATPPQAPAWPIVNYGAAPSETWSRGVREAAERVAKRKAAPAWSDERRLAFLRRAQTER